MAIYNMELSQTSMSAPNGGPVFLLKVGFGDPATNAEIVPFVAENAPDANGAVLLINGPASLPVAMALAHKYAHVFGAVAAFDPKLSGYVVAISHDPELPVGKVLKFDM